MAIHQPQILTAWQWLWFRPDWQSPARKSRSDKKRPGNPDRFQYSFSYRRLAAVMLPVLG
jgi:hypothetical protein